MIESQRHCLCLKKKKTEEKHSPTYLKRLQRVLASESDDPQHYINLKGHAEQSCGFGFESTDNRLQEGIRGSLRLQKVVARRQQQTTLFIKVFKNTRCAQSCNCLKSMLVNQRFENSNSCPSTAQNESAIHGWLRDDSSYLNTRKKQITDGVISTSMI